MSPRSEGAWAHNISRELGSSLGTAVIGAVMVAAVFVNLTDAALRAENLEASPGERDALAVELEDAAGRVSPEDGVTDRDFPCRGLPAGACARQPG